MKEANYSTGDYYHYTYDTVGNVLQYTQIQSGSTVTTAYDYNDANQLTTAQMDNSPVIWQYVYDPVGRLNEVLPDGNPANGAKRYTYNTAGYLMQTEAYESGSYQPQAEMLYDGLGQRLSMTGYALGTSVTTNYVLDPMQNGRPLSATSNGNATHYLYGLDPIAELTTSWSYSLPDGTGTPRQLTDPNGEITLAGSYTPWGDMLEVHGTGNFTFGYLGGMMDLASGLIYVGNGQYYDPSTGRFLTRDVNPNSTNPYVPWNPIGAIIGPLGLFSLIASRKRGKHAKGQPFLLMLFILVVLPLSIGMACEGEGGAPSLTEPVNFTATVDNDIVTATATVAGQTYTATAPSTPLAIPCPTPNLTVPTLGAAGTAYITIDDGPGFYTGAVLDVLAKYQVKATFFLVGRNIAQYPGEVQRMKTEGHAIGIHSWDHPAWGTLSTDVQSKQNQDTQQALQNAIGVTSNLFRAPGGAPTTADISQLYNYNWSHDTFDYYLQNGDPQVVADNVFKGVFTDAVPISDNDRIYTQNISIDATKHNQPIVLIHSIHPVDPPALELLILGFRERGYGFGILPRPGDSPGTITPISW